MRLERKKREKEKTNHKKRIGLKVRIKKEGEFSQDEKAIAVRCQQAQHVSWYIAGALGFVYANESADAKECLKAALKASKNLEGMCAWGKTEISLAS